MTVTLPAVRSPKTDTEERLLDHALTLFAEKGYEAASVREIIEATGVTRPVLDYYCSSKEDLFKRLVDWKHDEAYGNSAPRPAVPAVCLRAWGRFSLIPRLHFLRKTQLN